MQKLWQVAEKLDDDVWQQVLQSRGLTTEAEQANFFSANLEQLISPFDFPDINLATARIVEAFKAQQPIVVWGDFDADGVTSTAIMWETLHSLGAKVMPHIPNRDQDGHGFTRQGLEFLAEKGTKLIITVDHGVTAFEEVALARTLGIDVIISDHHEPRITDADQFRVTSQEPQGDLEPKMVNRKSSYEFPDCVAVIHPFRLADKPKLAGCGVAYFLAYAIYLAVNDIEDDLESRQLFATTMIELAALGTIADLMPLTGTNRVLAKLGLQALPKTQRVGLQQLFSTAGLEVKPRLSVYEVGFMIGPRLNAPGRLADALASLRLLCVKSDDTAKKLAKELDGLNSQRQQILLEVISQAKKELLRHTLGGAFVLKNAQWPAGVCGLAAGRLVELTYRPVVVMEEQGQTCRGSARSIRGFDITAALASMSDLLENFGGHAMAAGFVCKTEYTAEIEAKLSEMVLSQLSTEQLQPSIIIDAEVTAEQLNLDLVQKLQQLEPCGMGNPQAVFMLRDVLAGAVRVVGKDAKHLKLTLMTPQSAIDAIAFGFGAMADTLLNQKVDVVFNVEENVWNGKTSLQLNIKDIKITTSELS